MLNPVVPPALVEAALENARPPGFENRPEGHQPGSAATPSSCIDEVGALLRTRADLAALVMARV